LRALCLDAVKQSSDKKPSPVNEQQVETEILESLGPKLTRAVTQAVSEAAYSKDIASRW